MKWVKGHVGHTRNKGADLLAKLSTQLDPPDGTNMDVTPALDVTSAKLTKVSQALAYKAIQAKKLAMLQSRVPCSCTTANLRLIKDKIKGIFEFSPTDVSFWRAIQNQDFSHQSRYWLWMSTHDAYMTGSQWLCPNYNQAFQAQAFCEHDG